jgi:hypothetical protein
LSKAKAKRELQVTHEEGKSKERRIADVALDPRVSGAAVVELYSKGTFGPSEIQELYVALSDRARDVRENKLGSVDAMLTSQAAALNAIFVELARRSHANLGEYINAAERYMRLALKAQSQCRATLETLAAIKNPPIVYARQANIAAGHQQVNNGDPMIAREKKTGNSPNELLEGPSESFERLDCGTPSQAGRGNPEMGPVEAVDRAANGRREGASKSQCVQGR